MIPGTEILVVGIPSFGLIHCASGGLEGGSPAPSDCAERRPLQPCAGLPAEREAQFYLRVETFPAQQFPSLVSEPELSLGNVSSI